MLNSVQRMIILCEPDKAITSEALASRMEGASCQVWQSEEKNLAVRYEQYAKRLFMAIKRILMSKSAGNVLVQIVILTEGDNVLFRGLVGLLKTAQLENPKLMYQMIQLSGETGLDTIAERLEADGQSLKDKEIQYVGEIRYTLDYEETAIRVACGEETMPWKEGGVYIITGGAGGLGYIFAEEIAKKVNEVTLILTGRSNLNPDTQAKLQTLREMGANAQYKQADIADDGQARELFADVTETYGCLNGVLHSAGITRDHYIIHKTEDEFMDVLKPKVTGLLHIDTYTSHLNLDFIILFSSQAGVSGNPGQADYAAANAFMDVYAGYRNQLVEAGERTGKTISMNWPLWENGGMNVDKEVQSIMYESKGMIPMTAQTGIKALYQALAQGKDQVIVMEGDVKRLREGLAEPSGRNKPEEDIEFKPQADEKAAKEGPAKNAVEQGNLQEKAESYFKRLLSSVIKLPMNRIESDAPMEMYGINSLMIMQMTNELEKTFGSLSKTLFFEYQNIRSLTGYFLEFYNERLLDMLRVGKRTEHSVAMPERSQTGGEPANAVNRTKRYSRFARSAITKTTQPEREDIAIIGVAGRYPQAKNVAELWENLCGGKDCITEIPSERWDYRLHYAEDQNKTGKPSSKWGGFLDDVDMFDPLFFNISPREAEYMDPQERLFLECVIETLEDAGYTREALHSYQSCGLEGNVGVYVGVMYDEYQLYGAQEQANDRLLALNGITSSIANRVSYFCNFHGPSIGLNTMCSSSLVAIHLACQSIQQGECKLAIAGGVNVSIHPNKYLLLSRGNFVSSKGRCESFGKDGDGYVPGEGVGAILLKPLSKSIEDGDQIYGVIKGSIINHGGKTNGYTVPNPHAQASMIRASLTKAGVNARDISYIEAHGTGTSLGDPIEITALTKAFEDHTEDKQFCAIGSIKSNIGHLESAAGMAGVTKVLLQMKHGKLAPSLHAGVLNPNIDFEKTPFVVQQKLEEWKRPVIERNGLKKEYPRLAGISAFGAGGSNAHLVIEEYIPDAEDQAAFSVTVEQPAIILLSAKNEERLKEHAKQLLSEIVKRKWEDEDLTDIAYTLQMGREAMEFRLGMTVVSMKELEEQLSGFLAGHEDMENMYIGQANGDKDTLSFFKEDEDLRKAIESWINKGKYGKLLDLWVKGLSIPWELLYGGTKPKKISLPTYPFARERYWVPKPEANTDVVAWTNRAKATVQEVQEVHEVKERRGSQEVPISLSRAHATQNIQYLLREKTVQYFKQLLNAVTQIPVERIEAHVPLETYGIDSIMIKQLSGEIEKTFGSISLTIFFEYQCIDALAGYFLTQYRDKLIQWFGLGDPVSDDLDNTEYSAASERSDTNIEHPNEALSRSTCIESETPPAQSSKPVDIAIIGLSGRYPQARNIHEFWQNLKAGKDCVTEIPKERWDYSLYYDKDKFKDGKINSKWGGFISDVDKFDPLFFNISPEEAQYMDPQERLFLECVYETVEDAGYTRASLSRHKNLGLEGNVGVFVGVTFMEYQLYGIQSQMRGNPVALSGISSSIANRVSYSCNFQGPSLSIDSMCSSSLSALHVACDSIKQGSCQLAVVGGINLSLHPNKYLFLSQYNFMSSKGRCESFGSAGDGYVPGEGVGAVLLKPLPQAEADGDHIYGIIKSTAINHGGKTNGYSVPTPSAQANVIHKALIDANINPRNISYIEAHGTGTPLGDPIEIAGLSKAFDAYTEDREFCAIGSAKSSIGHLEAAAGIAGITKVLLQLKHKQLVPSLHAEDLNPNIDFKTTPFRVQQKLEAWTTPGAGSGGKSAAHPRIAGISSFGAGGSNAHVIIEEYLPRIRKPYPHVTIQNPVLIVLSAKKEESLKEQVKRLLEVIMTQRIAEEDLANVAYTLQVGRETMEERLGIIAVSLDDLKQKLEGFLTGKANMVDLYRSQGKRQKNRVLSLLESNEELQEVMQKWIESKKYSALLELWAAGMDVDWERLYVQNKPARISLPTYPFAREHYWLPEAATAVEENCLADQASRNLHPLHVDQADPASIMLQPVWKPKDVIQSTNMPTYVRREIIVLEAESGITSEALASRIEGADCQVWRSEEKDLGIRYEHYAKQLFMKIKRILSSKPKGNVWVQVMVFTEGSQASFFGGLGGLLKTAQQENPKLMFQLIHMSGDNGLERIVERLEANRQSLNDREIHYVDGIRYIREFEEMSALDGSEEAMPWKEGGVYIITGGAGGVGHIFAKEIAQKVSGATVVLTGRTKLNDKIQAQLKTLQDLGTTAQYKQVDITDDEQVRACLMEVKGNFGGLNGILHSAGIVRDKYIIHKTEAEFIEVLKPKVGGLLLLDKYTSDLNLDFIVLFSSGSGEFGNPGQADYAAANAFMDGYASYRNQLVETGERCGKTISMNWPLWENGGMKVDKDIQTIMFESKGMIPMNTQTGINALYRALAQGRDQVMVLVGDPAMIRHNILSAEVVQDTPPLERNQMDSDITTLKQNVIHKLAILFGESIKLSVNQIDPEEPFETYGIDSIKLTLLNQRLAQDFKRIPTTLFFEYRTLSALGEYLASEHLHESRVWVWTGDEPSDKKSGNLAELHEAAASLTSVPARTPARTLSYKENVEETELEQADEAIAVIGVSGRFPQAPNIEVFWENLKSGRDCITEVPKERWPVNGFFNSDRNEAVTHKQSFSKWGGFLEGFAHFDPLFFNISPAEAERMDPQERLFLEECWKAVEDAGYAPSNIDEPLKKHVGVFGGITKTGFNLWNYTANKFYSTSFSSMVNRFSYFMDFHGPSVAVDTMCSSSLAALHQACMSIKRGEISMAVVGAVNLYLHPSNYTSLSQAGLIADCSSSTVFGKGGVGFIPSEGVGAVVLKRLSDAERDNDHVWAVIKGSAISHSGRTNGYNVPDPAKQAAVIQQALDAANVDPRTIRHIEAAASGSELVDTIEMSAISKIYQKCRSEESSLYTMGSVKSVLGHGESVSGMAQFIKALLQLKHKMICPTKLPAQLNPKINFDTLPFKLETNLVEWPDVYFNEDRSPRRIGIDSFGAGGVYAHLIVEEYEQRTVRKEAHPAAETPNLLVFSAKTNHSLNEYLLHWIAYLRRHPDLDLQRLAYVLQTKREPMKRRFASLAHDAEELIKKMEDYLHVVQNPDSISEHVDKGCFFTSTLQNTVHEPSIHSLVAVRDWSKLAQLWVNGASIPWRELHGDYTPRHLSLLPTYPFRKKQYWIQTEGNDAAEEPAGQRFITLDSILEAQAQEMNSEIEASPVASVDRQAVPMQVGSPAMSASDRLVIQHAIQDILVETLYLDELDELDIEANFREMGLDSILMSQFILKLNRRLELNLRETVLFDYPNTLLLAEWIHSQQKEVSLA